MQTIFLMIAQTPGWILVGGDFNFCMDSVLDRSSLRPQPPTKASKLSKTYMKDLKLVDIWRQVHPSDRYYSFYSHPHNTHTRIDNFLLPIQLAHRVLTIDFLPRLLSDHSPLVMSISMPDKIRGTYRWRFKSTLLNQDDFVTFIREQINIFTLTNKPSCTNKFCGKH